MEKFVLTKVTNFKKTPILELDYRLFYEIPYVQIDKEYKLNNYKSEINHSNTRDGFLSRLNMRLDSKGKKNVLEFACKRDELLYKFLYLTSKNYIVVKRCDFDKIKEVFSHFDYSSCEEIRTILEEENLSDVIELIFECVED